MSREQANRFYATDYEASHESAEFFQRQRQLQSDRYLREFLSGVHSILDYGCGPGGKLSPLMAEGFEIFGYDPNTKFIEHALANGLRWWDEAAQYDCVFLSHTVEHWIDPARDLAALFVRNLKPGGLAIIEVPLVDRLLLGVRRGGISDETHLAHVWYFTVETLSALMRRFGFRLVFSDRLTTCIFRHVTGSEDRHATATPWHADLFLALIEFARRPLVARAVQRLNRSIGFIDLQFQRKVGVSSDVSLAKD